MWYLGGKHRQGKQIAQITKELIKPSMVYIEPFCGALGSALAVSKLIENPLMLSDANEALITMWQYAIDGYEFPEEISEEIFHYYKQNQDPKDPETAFIGCGCAFAGWWFETYARRHNGKNDFAKTAKKSIERKVKELKKHFYFLGCKDYKEYKDIKGQFFYLDPPYAHRKQHNFQRGKGRFDSKEFWEFVRELSKENCVITSEFEVPEDFEVLYSFGDTVTRQYINQDNNIDYGNEVIVMWNKCKYINEALKIKKGEKSE